MLSEEVVEAIRDVRYLLDRGYPRDSTVEFVSDHYLLELEKRHLITRCVFSNEEAENHRDLKGSLSGVQDKILGIDGYNVLITVESILRGDQIVKCDDGFIRDLQAIFGKYEMTEITNEAIQKILEVLEKPSPKKIFFFFDKQVSKSGELAGHVRNELKRLGMGGDARTVEGTDAEVWSSEVSASSDRVIIEKSSEIVDIPAEIVKDTSDVNLVDLTEIE